MPIEDSLLNQIIEEYSFERYYNHITATYHLIAKRNKRT